MNSNKTLIASNKATNIEPNATVPIWYFKKSKKEDCTYLTSAFLFL